MNKFKITAYMFLLWTVFALGGCAGKGRMYLEAKEQGTTADISKENADSGDTLADTPAADREDCQDSCFVYICGAVKNPGVFEVPFGSRIYEVITLAGGLKKNASVKGLNQAQQISDGDMIEILTIREQQEAEQETGAKAGIKTDPAVAQQDGKIDINTASAAELMTLNGIGEAKAANIITYREEHGSFKTPEELMDVSGIGEGVYAQIKDKITVAK